MALLRPLLLLLCACGLGAADGGGFENLPVSGAGPYGKLTDFERITPADEPFVVIDPAAHLADPSALPRGGGFRVFYTRTVPGGAPEIWRSDLPSLTDQATETAPVLTAASAPSVLSLPDGRLVMYHQVAEGIGRADSTDGGESWERRGVVLPDATSPGALFVDGTFLLTFTRPARPGIFTALSPDGIAFDSRAEPVLQPRPGRFDEQGVADPHAAGGVTRAGALHIAIFFGGTNAAGVSAIGYAGSDDGRTFTALPSPILEPLAPSERAPSAILGGTSAVLFVTQERAGRTAIAAATSP